MLLGNRRRIAMRVEVAFRRYVLQPDPIAGFDQLDRRLLIGGRFSLELLDQPHVVLVFMAVGCHLRKGKEEK